MAHRQRRFDRGAPRRRATFAEKLISGETALESLETATSLISWLRDKADTQPDVAVADTWGLCDKKPRGEVSLFHRCVYLLIEGGHLDDVLSFLEALFRERQYGPHKNQRVDIARHILTSVPSFVGAVLSNAPRRNADYAVPVVCMLLLLVTDVQFRQDMAQDQSLHSTRSLVECLVEKKVRQWSDIKTAYLSVTAVTEPPPTANTTTASLRARARPPGQREHGNDEADYRAIAILPTALELQDTEEPFLPLASPTAADAEDHSYVERGQASHLDRLFRLTREDLLGPVREEMRSELAELARHGEKKTRRMFPRPRLFDVAPSDNRGGLTHVQVLLDLPPHLRGRMAKMKSWKEINEFFARDGPGRRIFPRDSLVVFVNAETADAHAATAGTSSTTAPQDALQVVALGVVCSNNCAVVEHRDDKEEGTTHTAPSVHHLKLLFNVRLDEPLKDLLHTIQSNLHLSSTPGKLSEKHFRFHLIAQYAFSASASYFNFEPVLAGLQAMSTLPLARYTVAGSDPAEVGELRVRGALPLAHRSVPPGYYDTLPVAIRDAVASDPSQVAAMKLLFSEDIVLVQGPPGTGKTWTGVQMVKAMLHAEQGCTQEHASLRILCLCYTNHALDSFLEALIDAGVPKERFVRLGGSQRVSNRLKERCLRELPEHVFVREESREYRAIKMQMESLDETVKKFRAALQKLKWSSYESAWLATVSPFLSVDDPEAHAALSVPRARGDGMTMVGKKGKSIHSGYLWTRWCKGENAGVFEQEKGHLPLWRLNRAKRDAQRTIWNDAWASDRIDAFTATTKRREACVEDLAQLRVRSAARTILQSDVPIFIVGCTTISAAKNRALIQLVHPTVVLLEEAGEIFESQVLTSVSQDCKQLILIGDHKQLRPKAEFHKLTVDARNGYNVDESLFERLALATERAQRGVVSPSDPPQQVPMVTLNVQHRMRPEFADIIRRTMYPELQDAPTTVGRSGIPGMRSCLQFVQHDQPESSDAESALLGTNSKVNLHESSMVVALTRYLLQQDSITNESITIITPYLGQLLQIRAALKKVKLEGTLNERDQSDLARLDVNVDLSAPEPDTNPATAVAPSVRVATVDNFQGEEADIIIVSLVRSNRDRDVGFVASRERVNVMLSRAKRGLYVIGNFNMFKQAKSARARTLWTTICETVGNASIGPGFLTECARHPERHPTLTVPGDFVRLVPDGGCDQMCGQVLACGHLCSKHCHPDACAALSSCKVFVPDVCPYCHPIQRMCGDAHVFCKESVQWLCSMGHLLYGVCWKGRSQVCRLCEKLHKEEKALEDKHSREMQDLQNALVTVRARTAQDATTRRHKEQKDDMQKELELTRALAADNGAGAASGDAETATVAETAADATPSATPHHTVQTSTVAAPAPRIVPTAAKKRPSTITLPGALAKVLTLCRKNNWLTAYTLAEELPMSHAREAARLLIESELDVMGPWTAPPKEINGVSGHLSDMLCALASAWSCCLRLPLVAKSKVVPIVESTDEAVTRLRDLLPVQWQDRMQEIASFALPDISGAPAPPTSVAVAASQRKYNAIKGSVSPAGVKTALEKIMGMTGLEEVKNAVLDLYSEVKLHKERGTPGRTSYNVRFEGNPGTGKTSVARVYADLLKHLSILPQDAKVEELSASKMMNAGVDKLEKMLEEMKKVGGGVVFVDEAPQLISEREGKKLLDYILTNSEALEGPYGKLVWIFAGYKKDMEKLFEHNDGLPSRFKDRFLFADYTDNELSSLCQNILRKTDVRYKCVDEKHLRICMQRLGRRRGTGGFGNARAVRSTLDNVLSCQAARLVNARCADPAAVDMFELTREDFLGVKYTVKTFQSLEVYQSLHKLEGLRAVKDQVDRLIGIVVQNLEREEKGKPVIDVALNRLFLGNPGVGKTTVAKMYAEILGKLGLLSKGEVVMKTASDFVGDVIGSSEKTTRDILRSADGCVLVIDEAYGLCPQSGADPYRTAVLDTIVEQVQAKPGDDRAVVMLGYKDEMETMLKKANPGLARRFQLQYAFQFPDYNDHALMRILMAKARQQRLKLPHGVAIRAVRSLAAARAKPHFGNAGAVENLFSQAKERMMIPGRQGSMDELTLEDFDVANDGPDADKMHALFADLVGCAQVKQAMESRCRQIEFARSRGEDAKTKTAFNFLFLGPPGVGKTTVARKMGQMYNALGLIPSDECIEISASELVTGYMGQTGKQTREQIEKAVGGVLFIDEAYQLNPARGGQYMSEAVDELVKCLTHADFQSKMVVILAGYESDIDDMLAVNQGLRSRFTERIVFERFDAHTVVLLLNMELEKDDLELGASVDEKEGVLALAETLAASTAFANGRDVVTWSKKIYARVAERGHDCSEIDGPICVSMEDVKLALDEVLHLHSGHRSGSALAAVSASQDNCASASAFASPHAPLATSTAVGMKDACALDQIETPPTLSGDEKEEIVNPFDKVEQSVLGTLQDVLDERNENTEEGAKKYSKLERNSDDFRDLVARLVEKGMDSVPATEELLKWQDARKCVEEELEKVEVKKKEERVEPIWRCAVCGRADKPYIVCHVAPYIVGFRRIRE